MNSMNLTSTNPTSSRTLKLNENSIVCHRRESKITLSNYFPYENLHYLYLKKILCLYF